jgi:ATP/ADP translocase
VHRSIWEQAFIPVDTTERSSVKIVVDGVAARVAEALGALAILFWLRQGLRGEMLNTPLDTGWISWAILATVVIWLAITQKLRTQAVREKRAGQADAVREMECERFPDQCPCTTELGKGVA